MNYLYVSSRAQNRTYRYILPSIYGRTVSKTFEIDSRTGDIARNSDGHIWLASDNTQMPVQCYDSSGSMVACIGQDLLSSATGVTIDTEGNLWVSNNE